MPVDSGLDLWAAMEATPASRSPGLDGLRYKFYKKVFNLGTLAMENGLTGMLERGLLGASMSQGVIQLFPRVRVYPLLHN
jgi:hypothetical protein